MRGAQLPAGFYNTAHSLTLKGIKTLSAVHLAKSYFCLAGARLEQDLIVISSPPLLSLPSWSRCPLQVVFSPIFLPVSAQSWDQITQIIHVPDLLLKTFTPGKFTPSLHSLCQCSQHLKLGLCLLLPELVLVLAIPLDKNKSLQPMGRCWCMVKLRLVLAKTSYFK